MSATFHSKFSAVWSDWTTCGLTRRKKPELPSKPSPCSFASSLRYPRRRRRSVRPAAAIHPLSSPRGATRIETGAPQRPHRWTRNGASISQANSVRAATSTACLTRSSCVLLLSNMRSERSSARRELSRCLRCSERAVAGCEQGFPAASTPKCDFAGFKLCSCCS